MSSKIVLDLRNFKHLKSDPKSTTLQHKTDGHTITLAHKSLSPESQMQLKSLAPIAKQAQTPLETDALKHQAREKMAKGGEAKCYAEGDEVKKEDTSSKPAERPINKDVAKGAKTFEQTGSSGVSGREQPVRSLGEAWERFKSAYAKGGEVEVRRMYAEDGNVEPLGISPQPTAPTPDIGGVADVTGQQPGALPPLTPEETRPKTFSEMPGTVLARELWENRPIPGQNVDASMYHQPATEQPPTNLPENQPASQSISDEINQVANEFEDSEKAANQAAAPLNMKEQAVYDRVHAPDTYGHPNQPEVPQAPAADDPGVQKADLVAHDQNFKKDLEDGHIQPKTYSDLFANKSTLGKIGTIFGMILSGAGSGLARQPNAILAMMNKELENDLAAQIQSQNNKLSYYKANLGSFTTDANGVPITANKPLDAETQLKAATMAKMQMGRVAMHNIIENFKQMPENTAQEIAAKQAAASNIAMMAPMMEAGLFNIADAYEANVQRQKMLFGLPTTTQQQPAQGGMQQPTSFDPATTEANFQRQTTGLRMLGPQGEARAKEMEEKHLPGFPGHASIPIPQDVRNRAASMLQYEQKAREYINYANQHKNNWANMNPMQRMAIANQGAALAANLQSLYRNKIQGGVFKKGEQEYIQQIIPDQPAKWSAGFNAIPKVEQTVRDNRSDLNNLALNVGLPGIPTTPEAAPVMNQMKVKGANGVNYVRQIINGKPYMIPVQGE